MESARDPEARLRDLGLAEEDLEAWRRSGLPAGELDDWAVDRVARRPVGATARAVYGAEDVHDFARRAILQALALRPGERLLEIGCGGGLLLRDAIALGAAATGIDHSEEMVALARERAPGAEVVLASAEDLPFADAAFDGLAMSVVFMFLPDPDLVLRECRRVLAPRGRIAVYTSSRSLRGTPALPEPVASRVRLYEDSELVDMARRAGFPEAAVSDQDGAQLLTG